MHGMTVHAVGLSNVLREAVACKNLIAARACRLGSLHGDEGGGNCKNKGGYHEAAPLINPSV